MKKLLAFMGVIFVLAINVFSDCNIQAIEYHCDEGVCGCSLNVVDTESCYNDTWSQSGKVIIITNPYTPTSFEVYNYSSSTGTLESHDYVFDLDSLPCNNGTTFQYNYICNISLYNNSELYFNTTLGDFVTDGICLNPTTTTGATTTSTEATTTTEGSTTSTSGTTSSTSGGSTTSSSGTSSIPSTVPGTTLYGYALPNGNYGTLPGLNGSGGDTINNGTLKNMPCTGFCIIGLTKEEFGLYMAIMITSICLLSIKPFKLGSSAAAISLIFFNNVLAWTAFTTSLCLIFIAIAGLAWFTEGKK